MKKKKRYMSIKTFIVLTMSIVLTVTLGLCFFGFTYSMKRKQMDDLLDVEGDAAQMGKTLGKDAEEGKQTWIALRGAEGTREDIHLETGKALTSLEIFQERGKILREIALSMLGRNT